MSRLRIAFERFWREGGAVLGFVEALAVWPLRLRREVLTGMSPPVRNVEDVRRVLAWLGSPLIVSGCAAPGDDLMGQVRRGYQAANEDLRKQIREELALHLVEAHDPVLRRVLELAREIALVEGRESLLALLTQRFGPGAPAASGVAPSSVPAGAAPHDARADLVAALAALRDTTLEPLFRHLLAKFADGVGHDPQALEIGREAALGLWRLRPEEMPTALPALLRDDPILRERVDAPPAAVARV